MQLGKTTIPRLSRETLLKREDPGAAVLGALERLFACDAYLLEIGVNERTITHRFGMYLQEAMFQWDVDCEYNRNESDIKRLRFNPKNITSDDTDGKTVYPDVVVHRRGGEM